MGVFKYLEINKKNMNNLPNTNDYIAAIVNSKNILIPQLRNGQPIIENDKITSYLGSFCIVLPYIVANEKYAIRCWRCLEPKLKEKITSRAKIVSEELQKLSLPYFIDYKYYEKGMITEKGCQPIVVMNWIDAPKLKNYIFDNLYELNALKELAFSFKQIMKDLHIRNISHGDLQPGNVLIKNNQIIFIDYDTMYIPRLQGEKDDIRGLPGFQHETRFSNEYLTPKADYFSELVIYLSILALSKHPQLWFELNMEKTKTLLFSPQDIDSRGESEIFYFLKQDSDLIDLTEALISFCNKSNLDELCPLEDLLS
jgi:serine/threonine protein kinase